MERLVIIDHDNHRVFIDDVTDEELASYGGEEEKFIKDNYYLKNYSWDWVTEIQYFPLGSEEGRVIYNLIKEE